MKTLPDNTLIASRHSQGAKASVAASFMRRAVRHAKAVIDFIVREAAPLAMPAHGFQPENGTLCGAHWNRIYLVRGAGL
jgi:hypothetical protein